jgi:hypothetical protein
MTLALSGLAVVLCTVAAIWNLRTYRRVKTDIAEANEYGVPYSQLDVARTYERSADMERLVRWLALSFRVVSYLDDGREVVTWNTPIFPKEYPWGEDMPEAQEMERLYHEVIGPPTQKLA